MPVEITEDRAIREGFPKGWYVQDRLKEDRALLVCPSFGSLNGERCLCVRPRAISTEDWLPTARAIAAALSQAAEQPVAMTVIDPDAWEPCSPAYLSAGGSCDAPRVWSHTDRNHWHPKLAARPPCDSRTETLEALPKDTTRFRRLSGCDDDRSEAGRSALKEESGE